MKNLTLKSVHIIAVFIISNICLIQSITAWAGSYELPDIASSPGIEIAGTDAHWGGGLKIDAKDAEYNKNGKCVFRYGLDLINLGNSPTGEFGYRINVNGWSKTEIHSGVQAKEEIRTTGEIELRPGKQKLVLKLDNKEQIYESDESNNLPFAVLVDVKGKCNSEIKEKSIIATK